MVGSLYLKLLLEVVGLLMEFRKYLRTLQKMLVVTQNVHVHYLNGPIRVREDYYQILCA